MARSKPGRSADAHAAAANCGDLGLDDERSRPQGSMALSSRIPNCAPEFCEATSTGFVEDFAFEDVESRDLNAQLNPRPKHLSRISTSVSGICFSPRGSSRQIHVAPVAARPTSRPPTPTRDLDLNDRPDPQGRMPPA